MRLRTALFVLLFGTIGIFGAIPQTQEYSVRPRIRPHTDLP